MPTPTDMLKEYNVGDRLKAEDVNALIKAAKRINESPDGSGDTDGYAARGHKHRVSLDLDGIYDVPLYTRDTSRIPPFSVVAVKNPETPVLLQDRRAYYVTKFPSSTYVPTFAVAGPYGIPVSDGSNATIQRGSLLFSGGWVAVDTSTNSPPNLDNDNVDYTFSERSWGPKPGSFLLTYGYSGFRTLGNSQAYKDPVTNDVINIIYAYQIPRAPRAYISGKVISGGWMPASTSFDFVQLGYENTEISYILNSDLSNIGGGNANLLRADVAGLYEYHCGISIDAAWTVGASTTQTNTLTFRPTRVESDGTTKTQIATDIDVKCSRISSNPTFNSASLHGIVNLPTHAFFGLQAKVDNTTFGPVLTGCVYIRRIDDLHYHSFVAP